MHWLAAHINRLNDAVGRSAAWLVLLMVLVQFGVVVARYIFGIGSILMQEAVIYMHGCLFMLAAADTLLKDEHVRVDIFYARLSARRKALIDILGCALLVVPICVLILLVSWDYVALAWSVREGSRETSGIQGVYLLKSVILLFAALLFLQAISLILTNLTRLKDGENA